MSDRKLYIAVGIAALTALFLFPAFGSGPNFAPEVTFKGSSLAGWHTLGQADWKAQNGEIVGTPKEPGGGWLVLDRSFQDIAFYANVHCTGGCQAGVLFRAEKDGDGLKGVYVSLNADDLGSFAVKLGPQGQILSRQKLEFAASDAGGRGGSTTTTNYGPDNGRGIGFNLGVLPLPAGLNLPDLARPTSEYRPGQWNEIDLVLAEDRLKPALNGGASASLGTTSGLVPTFAPDAAGKYGPMALYVGGSAPVQFKSLMYRDLNARPVAVETVSSHFRLRRLNELFYSWTATVADINRDGKPDVIAGPFYYLGPDFKVSRELYTPVAYNPTNEYPQGAMVSLAYDFTGDGWPDILQMSGNAGNGTATLYVNPKGESRRWDSYVVIRPVGNEVTLLKDIDGDGKPEVIHAGWNCLQYSKPDPANPTGKWITKTISEPGPWGANIGHGIGVGDINGDGRMDLVTAYGWWEQPSKDSKQELWTYHPQKFGRYGRTQGGAGGAEIAVYDVNGDGLNDVVATLEGHGFGMAWYEQKRDAAGHVSFVEHMIMDNFLTKNAGNVIFTEPHAIAFADMDGDGLTDFVVGKSPLHHLATYTDPDPFGPAVLYWYRLVRDPKAPGGAEFVPELIHSRSGVGCNFVVTDVNGDGTPDIVISDVNGTFIFLNEMKPHAGAVKTAAAPAHP
jgi:hypothetical protein